VMNMFPQILSLFIIALPIASIAWTITHEEIVREFHEFCVANSKTCRFIFERKFFYLFTCEYCFSHYVTAFFLIVTRYKLLFPDWRGYLIAGFSLVWWQTFTWLSSAGFVSTSGKNAQKSRQKNPYLLTASKPAFWFARACVPPAAPSAEGAT